MEIGQFTDYEGGLTTLDGHSVGTKYRKKFDSVLINSSHAVQKLIDTVADDLENNPLMEGEDYIVMRAIREALNNIYTFDTEPFFDITIEDLEAVRPTVRISVKDEKARRALLITMENKLDQELNRGRK